MRHERRHHRQARPQAHRLVRPVQSGETQWPPYRERMDVHPSSDPRQLESSKRRVTKRRRHRNEGLLQGSKRQDADTTERVLGCCPRPPRAWHSAGSNPDSTITPRCPQDHGCRSGALGPLQRAARTTLAAEPHRHDPLTRSRTTGPQLVPKNSQGRFRIAPKPALTSTLASRDDRI